MVTVSIFYPYLPECSDIFSIANDNSYIENRFLGSQKFILDCINWVSFLVKDSVIIFQKNLYCQ